MWYHYKIPGKTNSCVWGIFNFWFLLLGIFEVSCLFFVGCWKCSFQTISLTWLTWYCWFVTKDSNNYYLYNRIGNNSEFQFFREVKSYNIPTFKGYFQLGFCALFFLERWMKTGEKCNSSYLGRGSREICFTFFLATFPKWIILL